MWYYTISLILDITCVLYVITHYKVMHCNNNIPFHNNKFYTLYIVMSLVKHCNNNVVVYSPL